MKNTNNNLTNNEGVNKNSKLKAVLKAILLPFVTFFVLFISSNVIYNSNLSGYDKDIFSLVLISLVCLIIFTAFIVKLTKDKNYFNLIKSSYPLLIPASILSLIYTHLDNPINNTILNMSNDSNFYGHDEILGYIWALFRPIIIFYFFSLFFNVNELKSFNSAIKIIMLFYMAIIGLLLLSFI